AQNYKLGEVEVRSPKAHFMAYQAGVKVSKAFDLSSWKVEPSLAAHYVDASSKRLSVAVNDNTFSQRFGRYLKTEVGVGVTKGQWQ
ncbi:autotransporter outer membrane beta-barrel domain-containing protein, partial [Mannheimia haemolytica]